MSFLRKSVITTKQYDEIIVLDFIKWLEKAKRERDLSSISKNRLIELISMFLDFNHSPSNENKINFILSHVIFNDSIFDKVKKVLGLKKTYKILDFYFDYQSTKYALIVLFPHSQHKSKLEFFSEYYIDLNSLSSNFLSIFYSLNDTIQKSGYEIIEKLGRTQELQFGLPAILVWDTSKGINSSKLFPIKGMSNQQLFRFFEKLILNIKKEKFRDNSIELDMIKYISSTPLEHKEQFNSIKAKVGENKIEWVFSELGKIIENHYPYAINQIVILSAENKRINQSKFKGIISEAELNIKANLLNDRILNLIDSLVNE